MLASGSSVRKLTPREEQALRQLAGRAIHRPTDLGMKEVVALASAVIAFLEAKPGGDAPASNR